MRNFRQKLDLHPNIVRHEKGGMRECAYMYYTTVPPMYPPSTSPRDSGITWAIEGVHLI